MRVKITREPDELENDDQLDPGRLSFYMRRRGAISVERRAFSLRSAPLITILPQRKVAIAATSTTSHVKPSHARRPG